MLVTKREAKQASKKLLSILLAVIMMMTSMSVCFGTFTMASAANLDGNYSAYTADPFEYLASTEHGLNGATVKSITDSINIGNIEKSGNANNKNNVTYITEAKVATYAQYTEVRDILIYLDKAIKQTKSWTKGTEDDKDEQTKSCASAGDVEADLIDSLEAFGTVTDAAKEFITYVLEDEKARQHDNSVTSSGQTPAVHTATFRVYTEDYKGYLDVHEGNYTAVPASLELGYSYSFYLKGDLYWLEKGTCGDTYHYHNMIWNKEGTEIKAPSTYKTNTDVKSKLTAYANYVDKIIAENNFDTLAAMTLAQIEALESNLDIETNAIKSYIADAGEGKQDEIYDKLFSGYESKISAFKETSGKAKEIAKYSETVAEITAYQTNNSDYGVFNWGGFDEATIKADYAAFMGKYSSIINDATLYDYFVRQGSISDTFVKNFRDNVIAYDLEDLKLDKVDVLYDDYKDTWNDIELAEKQVVYSTLSGYINNYNGYTAQVQNAIFTSGIEHLLDLQEKLECQVASCVLYFAENVGVDYSDVSTEEVIAEIAAAKSNLSALNSLKNSVDYADNTALLDGAFVNADTFIAYLYSLLADRYTAQVEVVDDTYTDIGRPNSNLTLSQYSNLNAYVNGIEQEIVSFLDAEGKGALVTSETRAKYAAIETELMPAFNAFEVDRGFNNYSPEDVLIRREDNSDEFFRVNEDLDGDGVGEYEVTDENVEHIINVLEAALKDETVKKLLGDLINKDEDGNPTGEAFSLSGLITGLLEDVVYTDNLINTIVQYIYPLVAKEFAKVWAGLPSSMLIPDVDTGMLGITADVDAGLSLYDVETAIAAVGIYLAPTTLAAHLESVNEYKGYTQVIEVLKTATSKAVYNKDTDTFRDPWQDTRLFKDVVDEETGEVSKVYNLDWGIDSAAPENKKAAFVNAACAALSGLEPLLFALLSNQAYANANDSDPVPRGVKIGIGEGSATALAFVDLHLTIDPITLVFKCSANDGWDNALAPIFEALGLENIPHSEDLTTTRKILEDGLLAMIDQLIAKLDANPLEFLLNALPNLAYALEGGLVEPLLHQLKTQIDYYADAAYDAGIASGSMPDAMKSEEPIVINIGEMINLADMGLDISNFAAIWNMIAGGVEMLAGLEAPDASYIASLGTLVEKDTNRSVKTYTAGTAGKAFHIEANKADVLKYLVQWVLGSGLLSGLVEEPSELIATIFSNLESNPGQAVAAIVELLNQQAYPAKSYDWFDGTIDGETVTGNSATAIYMNPGNDWTKEKAEYLYENLDSLVTAILALAKLDLNKETPEVDGSIGEILSGAVNGLLTDKTLTSLAALLAKLDLNALLNEGKTEEELADALDVNALVNQLLGLDLAAVAAQYADIAAAVEADPEYVHDFGVDAGTSTFAAELTKMLEPLNVVLNFILEGDNLEITLGEEKVTLLGAEGYNNAIVPLLEALGCTVEADPANALEATINALVARVDALAEGDVIKNIIDLLPGVLYFITSNGLSTTVLNLLQPILVIVDTIRPVFDAMDLINGLEIGEEGAKQTLAELLGGEINLKKLDIGFVFDLLPAFIDLDLSGLEAVIYDVVNYLGVDYTSASDLQTEWKKGAYNASFDQADMLTVLLSFVLEWATIKENGEALDEMLGTDGIIASIGKVFEDVEIAYGTPNWYYWFDSEDEFNDYVAGNKELPNTLLALEYPNDWSEESAKYIADNLASLVDMVIGLIEINGKKYDSVSALLNDLVYGDFNITVKAADEENEAIVINYLFSDETINAIIGLLKGILANIDETLLSAGYILDVDVVGLKNYTCDKEITTIDAFFAELAFVLDTYAKGLVDLLFFGDDFRIAKKSDATDTIVINGGLGYEKGLALILEALGCDAPAADEATVATILDSLATRVEAILANPVNEVIDLLPNLVYFLNANGASVAVNNLLAPVYALLDKINGLGLLEKEIDLADMLGFDLKYLSLEDILALVTEKAGLDLSAAEAILVDLCIGKIEEAEYTYKMTADREDTVTVILTTALLLVSDEDFAAKLEEMLGTDVISAIKTVFESAPVEYKTPDWSYAVADNETLEVIDYAITYPNNWTEESAAYLAENLGSIGNMVAGLIDSNYATLGDLLADKVDIYTPELLTSIQTLLGDLIGGLDEDLKELVNVGLGAADALLGADVQGLLDYDVSGVKDKETFVAALTGMLMEVEGLVDWLLLGQDYELFVDDVNANGVYDEGEAIITLNGGHGYAEGLALVLEALGVEGLPEVYTEEIDTEAIVSGVLAKTFDRVDAILADPITEVFDILPNVLYFINANGLTVAVNNLLGAVNALLIKLEGLGIELDIASLVDFSELLGVETELALDNITMKDAIALVAELTGLNLDKVADVLVGFALGEINTYDSVSRMDYVAKMEYKDDFDKHDMITVLATVAIMTLTDDANADKVKELLGEDIYQLVLNLINMGEVPVQDFDWAFTDRVGETFSVLGGEAVDGEIVEGSTEIAFKYGPLYTKEMEEYIAENFGTFVNNIIYLLGLDLDGDGEVETELTEIINGLLGGSLYNSSMVITIRDALAGVLANLTELEVNGAVVGGHIAEILKATKIADIKAVAEVDVPEFTEDRDKFVKYLCEVLEPLYGILKYVLADEDLSFFVNEDKTDAITLKGAEGYAFGIIPLLEALGCENIMTPAEYYAAVEEGKEEVLLTSILNPLLDRVDVIIENPAVEVLDILTNLLYFINSNGVDTVVKNTLNAVYALLAAIEPIAKIDLYEIIGLDLSVIDADWLIEKLLEVLANAGYAFEREDINFISELTVGTLTEYTSVNGNTAYKMVYETAGEIGTKEEMVTVVLRLAVLFLGHEQNQEILLDLLRDKLGMSEEIEPYVKAILEAVCETITDTHFGTDTALATIYYIFYGLDTGVDGVKTGVDTVNQKWKELLNDLGRSEDPEEATIGNLIAEVLGWDIFEDIIDPDEGIAPNGFIKFFQKIIEWFKAIVEWFKNLFAGFAAKA